MTFAAFIQLVILSIREPREAVQTVLSWGAQGPVLWMGLVLASVLSTLLSGALGLLFPGANSLMGQDLGAQPLLMAGVQVVSTILIIVVTYRVGRAAGGTARYDDVFAVIVWLQMVLIALQALQFVLILAAPVLGSLVGLVAFALLFYLLTMFVTEVHGFTSPGMVFAMILLTIFGIAMILSIFISIFVGVPAEGSFN